MNPSSSQRQHQLRATGAPEGARKKTRKPYTITKSREGWTEEEHDRFLVALQLYDRNWKKVEDFVGSKTVIQIRSHAQKYFLKVQKNLAIAPVPPPRPERKAAHHPYPQKFSKYVCIPWNDTSKLTDTCSNVPLPNKFTIYHGVEGDMKLAGKAKMGNHQNFLSGSSSKSSSNYLVSKKGYPGSLKHAVPDFAKVYSFIGSLFDPGSEGHMDRLKEMDPINVETVFILMRNLTINLSSPESEPLFSFLF